MRVHFIAYIGILLAGCAQGQGLDGADQKGKKPVQGDTSKPAAAPSFKLEGARSGVRTARFALVRDQKALTSLLKEHNPVGEFDTKGIDFKKHDVVAYFAGSKPTGGFSVELLGVDRAKESGKESATVKFRLMKPGKGSMVIQAFTSPFLIQSVEKLPAKVTHTVTEQERPAR
jgi:hypothetical protein